MHGTDYEGCHPAVAVAECVHACLSLFLPLCWHAKGVHADRPGVCCLRVALTVYHFLLQSELHGLLQHDHLNGAALLVFANKQDLKDAMSVAELSEALGLHTIKSHSHHIQASCALTGDGLKEGLSWVAQKVHGGSE